MSIFENAKLTEVFFRYGKFDNHTKGRFVHAPFDRLELNGEMYVITRGIGDANGLDQVAPWAASHDNISDLDGVSGRDVWWTELNPIVIGDNEMGNWSERGDDWTGMFCLGWA